MAITRAASAQADVVGLLLSDFNAEFDMPCPSAKEFARRFMRLLQQDDQLVLLAGDPADPIGFAYVTVRSTPYYDGPLMQLEELYVRPQQRDQGIGTQLLQDAVHRAQELGCGEIHINVDEIDTDTRRFYERHGFTNIEPGENYRMLCYIREL